MLSWGRLNKQMEREQIDMEQVYLLVTADTPTSLLHCQGLKIATQLTYVIAQHKDKTYIMCNSFYK